MRRKELLAASLAAIQEARLLNTDAELHTPNDRMIRTVHDVKRGLDIMEKMSGTRKLEKKD